jgi:ATP-dependent DNA ligase
MPTKTKSKTSKRSLIEPHEGDKRYVRRNKQGEFKKEVDVERSLAADRRSKAKTKVPKGQGDRGDVKRWVRVMQKMPARLRFIAPMECLRVETIPDGAQWQYELDGYRTVAVNAGEVSPYSRNGNSYKAKFPRS